MYWWPKNHLIYLIKKSGQDLPPFSIQKSWMETCTSYLLQIMKLLVSNFSKAMKATTSTAPKIMKIMNLYSPRNITLLTPPRPNIIKLHTCTRPSTMTWNLTFLSQTREYQENTCHLLKQADYIERVTWTHGQTMEKWHLCISPVTQVTHQTLFLAFQLILHTNASLSHQESYFVCPQLSITLIYTNVSINFVTLNYISKQPMMYYWLSKTSECNECQKLTFWNE